MKNLILILMLVCAFAGFEAKAQKGPPSPEASANYDKAYEEYLKKLAEVQEKNKQITANNAKISRLLLDGAKAYNAKDYQSAIEKFDEAFNLDPDFWGSAPILLMNKGLALRALGAEKYNNAIRDKADPKAEANQYFLDSVIALTNAKKILETAPIPENDAQKTFLEQNKLNIFNGLAESYRLLVLTDEACIYEAIEAFENYIKIENDEVKKQKAQETLKKLKTQYQINY